MAETEPQCKLLGPFSLLVQGILGILSLSSLIYKRYKEYPNRRPWKVWFFDVSKQLVGAVGIHFLNLLLSILGNLSSNIDDIQLSLDLEVGPYMIFSGNNYNIETTNHDVIEGVSTIAYYLNMEQNISNPCNWYFLNIMFDTTVGVPILWSFLYVIYKFARYAGIKGINSGQYGAPPKLSYYFKQLVLYLFGLFSMKLLVYILLITIPSFEKLANVILSVFDPFPRMQVFIVIFVTPLVMNSLQYILIDNIIQSPEYKKAKGLRIIEDIADVTNEDQYIREHLPQQGLLGQPEPDVFEGERLYNRTQKHTEESTQFS